MDWLEGTILEHEGIEGPATSMLPSLWEARIRAAHTAEVERVTAELRDMLKGALIPKEIFGENDICPRCSGWGFRAYPNTTTWAGGIGGQAITNGVCDVCWGTGQKSKIGANLRELSADRKKLQARVERLEGLVVKADSYLSLIYHRYKTTPPPDDLLDEIRILYEQCRHASNQMTADAKGEDDGE